MISAAQLIGLTACAFVLAACNVPVGHKDQIVVTSIGQAQVPNRDNEQYAPADEKLIVAELTYSGPHTSWFGPPRRYLTSMTLKPCGPSAIREDVYPLNLPEDLIRVVSDDGPQHVKITAPIRCVRRYGYFADHQWHQGGPVVWETACLEARAITLPFVFHITTRAGDLSRMKAYCDG